MVRKDAAMNTPPHVQFSWLVCFDSGRLVSYSRSTSSGKDPCILELFLEYSENSHAKEHIPHWYRFHDMYSENRDYIHVAILLDFNLIMMHDHFVIN
jgi:hypothetical protein